MYSLYSIISVHHNTATNQATWSAINGTSQHPFIDVGCAESATYGRAVLLAICGALDGLAKKYPSGFVEDSAMPTPIGVLAPDTLWADRLNSLTRAPTFSGDRGLFSRIADYKAKAQIKFYSSIADVPPSDILARVFRGWQHGHLLDPKFR